MSNWFKTVEKKFLIQLNQKCQGYQWMCFRSSTLYSIINNIFIISAIISNGILTVLNAEYKESNSVRKVTMAISGSTAILIGISSFLRLPEKSSFFSFQKARYDRLQSHIQTELITPSGRDPQEVVNDVRAQYSNLEENYIYAIPRYVSSSYRDMVANRNIAVPIICNGFDNFENNIVCETSENTSANMDVNIDVNDSPAKDIVDNDLDSDSENDSDNTVFHGVIDA